MMKILTTILALILSGGFSFGKTTAVLPDIYKPGFLSIDGCNVYIIDRDTVNIYSFGDYKFKKKFGDRGEGPQEFKYEIGFLINTSTEYILVESLGKMSYFSNKRRIY
jgi:hypothetical protein